MLFGRKKPGFVLVEPVRDEKVIPGREEGEKPELMEYLASLPDAEDPFAGIEPETEPISVSEARPPASQAKRH